MYCTVHYASPPERIGNHEWRIIVVDSLYETGARMTKSEWRRLPSEFDRDPVWHGAQQWPSYGLHRRNNGMPKSLDKVFYRHEQAIRAALIVER